MILRRGDGEKQNWRPVRESNPCRRREREATYSNSTELSGMDSTLQGLTGTLIERLMDARRVESGFRNDLVLCRR